MTTNDAPNQKTTLKTTRDRPTSNPGGMECTRCGCIFIGAEHHQFCGVCIEIVASTIAEKQQP